MVEERTWERGRRYRTYTQHNAFFFIIVIPLLIALASFAALAPGVHSFDELVAMDMLPILVITHALGPAIGVTMLVQQGPLVIDPVAETLTYRRHAIPFSRLGLVRIRTAKTLVTSVSYEGGSSTDVVDVEVVRSGDFCLNPEDWLPRRRRVRLANRLNDTLADYYRRIGEPRDPFAPSSPAR